MRAFFATGYQTRDGPEVSKTPGCARRIPSISGGGNPAKPLSDEALMKALAKQGITVARRTVAKYREQLSILPSPPAQDVLTTPKSPPARRRRPRGGRLRVF